MKGLKGIVSVLLVGAMAFSLCACSSVKEVAPKEFKSIVKDVMDCDKEDLREYDKDWLLDYEESEIYYVGDDADKYYIDITEYEDEDAAKYVFERDVNNMEFYKKHDNIDGKIKIAKNYYVIDAEVSYGYDADSVDVYGGSYLAGNYIITVSSSTGKDKDKDVIDELIDALGYPKPSRA